MEKQADALINFKPPWKHETYSRDRKLQDTYEVFSQEEHSTEDLLRYIVHSLAYDFEHINSLLDDIRLEHASEALKRGLKLS